MSRGLLVVRILMAVCGALAAVGCVLCMLAGHPYNTGVGFGLAAGTAATFLAFAHLHEQQSRLIDEQMEMLKEAAARRRANT